jgi:hypothetical protein
MATTATPLRQTAEPTPKKNALHEAINFLLHHQAIHNPETAKEAKTHSEAIAQVFSEVEVPTER